MQNEQCGRCWNLKFDRLGDKTHEDLKNDSHKFVPLDYCVKCKKLKYDQFGIPTHQDVIDEKKKKKSTRITHNFISAIETKSQEKKRKKRKVFRFLGFGLGAITSMVTMSNLFF